MKFLILLAALAACSKKSEEPPPSSRVPEEPTVKAPPPIDAGFAVWPATLEDRTFDIEWHDMHATLKGRVPVGWISRSAGSFKPPDGGMPGIMDPSIGWSFGGYMSALAVLRRPDVFKAAVAGAPVTDWEDYDTHYTERYLGMPDTDKDAYKEASLLTYAADLKRPLLLIHGTADDNVYFRHTLKLADALFRAGKDFELLPLSGLTHMVPDPVVTQRLWSRIAGHFQKHLGSPR